MRRRGLALFILLAVASAGLIWSIRTVFPRSVLEVEVVHARRGTLELTLPVSGLFEAHMVELAFDAPGRLTQVTVREGDVLAAGALVAAIDDAEARAAAEQAGDALSAAEREAERAVAATESARRQAEQAEAVYRAARATVAQLRAGPRPQEVNQTEAAVEAGRTALEEARRSLQRAEQLFREGALSQAQLDAARAEVKAAEARLRQAAAQRDLLRAGARPEAIAVGEEQARQADAARQAALANVRQAEAGAAAARARVAQAAAALRAAAARLDRSQLRAPFGGTVTRVFLNAGSPVAPGLPVASLAATGGWITADVDEADIAQVRLGQAARVTADAYPGRTLNGKVTRIGRQVEVRLGSRVVRVRIDLDGGAVLRVGTSVDVRLLLQTIPDALLAPVEAVIASPSDGAPHVFLVEGTRLRRRDVQTGPGNDEFIIIRKGLREGETVAVGEPGRLRDGLRIRVTSLR